MEELEKEFEQEAKEKQLTGKQERFCQEYILCLNKGKAYSIAYNRPNITPDEIKNNSSLGCRLYGNERVNARIKELVAEANKKCDVSLDFILKEQLNNLELIKKGKREMKLNADGGFSPTGEIEYDHKAYNQALKNLSDFTGLSKQVIEARITGKQEVSINKSDQLAESLFADYDPNPNKKR